MSTHTHTHATRGTHRGCHLPYTKHYSHSRHTGIGWSGGGGGSSTRGRTDSDGAGQRPPGRPLLCLPGAAWSWGWGASGQLGHGDAQNQLLPKKIEAFAGQRVVAVSAAERHSLALTAADALWSWGGGLYGKLGHGDQQNQLLPKKIEAFPGGSASSLCRLGRVTASPSPPAAVSGAGAMATLACWATATSRTGCCRRRSRPWLASASPLFPLDAATASLSPPTAPSLPGARARPAA